MENGDGVVLRSRAVPSAPRASSPTIFLSIAAYRDPQVVPTVEDCIAKAARPRALRFGICWQHDRSDPQLPFVRDKRLRVLDYDWHDARGIGWARAECMSLFDGEDFYLQLDSHHRFVEGWDDKLRRYMELSGSAKPILTSHAANLDVNAPEAWNRLPSRVVFAYWSGHIPLFRHGYFPRNDPPTRPIRARSISGHFLFAIGDFAREVRADPEIFLYGGAEITVAVRAFTSGYDLFHPPEAILCHAYANLRPDRRTAWGDQEGGWQERFARSNAQLAEFLTNPDSGEYGCGTARSMEEYEAYAGLSFRHCRAQDYTRLSLEPPNPPAPPGWAEEPRDWNVRLSLISSALPPAITGADAWEVRLEDALGRSVHEELLDKEDVSRLLGTGSSPSLDLKFHSAREPAVWLLGGQQEGTNVRVIRGPVGRSSAQGTAVIEA